METILNKLESLRYLIFHHSRYLFCFKYISYRSRLLSPLKIDGAKNIHIERLVVIGKQAWLAAKSHGQIITPKLVIKEGCKIGNFNHIYCTGYIVIENDVLTADKVYISDNLHSYEDISTPIYQQPIKQLKPVTIGQGSWLGENVCVIGASIGKGSVIGANSVVTHDIPDYSVAVGAPAKVIKQYNHKTKQWEKVS